MRYLSVCSGIEAVSLAWKSLGWTPVAFSEIEPFPCALLAHHYPGVPNWGDMTKFKEWPDAAIDVLVGGTPCQSFSVAGLRGGLDDPRGNLCLTYLAIADRYRPDWLVWENVPGVLSSAEGRDFGSFIGGLEQLGYHAAWRVLDAQFVRVDGLERAVPQRRRRVFVVGYLGDWRRAAAVLFERESLCWNHPPRRQAGKRIAPTVEARAGAGGAGWGTDFLADGGMAAVDVAPTMRAGGNETGGHRPPGTDVDTADSLIPDLVGSVSSKWAKGTGGPAGDKCYNLVAAQQQPYSIMPMNSSKDYKARPTDVAQPVMAGGPVGGNQGGDYIVQPPAIAIQERAVCENPDAGPDGAGVRDDGAAYTLEARQVPQAVAFRASALVRRLTPRECERLQGIPDDYTLIAYRGRPAADGNRYKALGNCMAVNCIRWLGERIAMVETLPEHMA
jgi:DNA (cytosine-5)-methyltransferase 1